MRWPYLVIGLCNVFSICFALSFDSSVLVTNNLSSITALPAPAPKSCGGCTIYEGLFEFLWYSEVYTHTAATVVKFVNNSTNVTRTSTIYGTDFVLPESAGYAANLVPGRVITTEIGDMNHTLTYPSKYQGVRGGLHSDTFFLATDSAGNVQCVTSSAFMHQAFLLSSVGDWEHVPFSISKDCLFVAYSPPSILVPVLSLTQTETQFEQSQAPETSAAGKAAPSKPIIAPTVTPTSSAEAGPRETPPAAPKSLSTDSRPTKPNAPPQTTSNAETSPLSTATSQSLDRGPASEKDQLPLPSAVASEPKPGPTQDETIEASKAASTFNPTNNSPESNTPDSLENIFKSINSAHSGNDQPSKDVFTNVPTFGGPAEAKSTPAPQLVLPIGSSTISANSEGDFIIADQTLVPGGSPVTALEKSIYLQPSNAAAIVDGSTVSVQQIPSKPTPPIVLPIGSSSITANSEGNFVIDSQTLVPGGSPVTALGKSIYLQASNAAAVVDGSTVLVQQVPPKPSYFTPPIVLPIGSTSITANSEGNFVIESQTLIPGGSPVTALGKSIYLQASNAAAVVDGSTVRVQQAAPKPSYFTPPIVLPIGSTSITANSEGNFVIESQTLIPGGSPVTALGKSIYLQPSGSAAVINGNTVALAQAPQTFTAGTQTIGGENGGEYIPGSQISVPEITPITTAGLSISPASSASVLIGNTTTIVFKFDPGALLFGSQIIIPDHTGGYILGSQTLHPGRAPITIEGKAYSLAYSASALIIGSETLTPRPVPELPPIIKHQEFVEPTTTSEYLIAGQTLVAGAPPISISGQPVSLGPGEFQVVIGSSTKTLTSDKSDLASLILQGLGNIGSGATPTTTLKSNGTSPTLTPVPYTGGAGTGKWRMRTSCIGLGVFIVGVGIII